MSEPMPPEQLERLYAIIDTPDLPSLGPERRGSVKPPGRLRSEVEAWMSVLPVSDRTRQLILGAALLWHDHLDESHSIAQDIPSAEGSFLHGIMHRREPDYSNAKYWFHRVGRHAAFPEIAARAQPLLSGHSSALRLLDRGAWDPMRFIDACEAVAERPAEDAEARRLRQLQQIEFNALLDYICHHGWRSSGSL